MLIATFGFDDIGNTVPYPPLFDSVRRNYGFVDLRGRPDLAETIVEGSGSAALRQLLIALAAKDSPLCRLGCDLGERLDSESGESQHCVAGGYIQWILSPAAYYDPGIYDALGRSLAESLEMVSEGHAWEINFLIKMVDLNLDQQLGLSPSHWIWFDAYSATPSDARASREALLEKLLHAIRTLNFHELIEREEDEE